MTNEIYHLQGQEESSRYQGLLPCLQFVRAHADFRLKSFEDDLFHSGSQPSKQATIRQGDIKQYWCPGPILLSPSLITLVWGRIWTQAFSITQGILMSCQGCTALFLGRWASKCGLQQEQHHLAVLEMHVLCPTSSCEIRNPGREPWQSMSVTCSPDESDKWSSLRNTSSGSGQRCLEDVESRVKKTEQQLVEISPAAAETVFRVQSPQETPHLCKESAWKL